VGVKSLQNVLPFTSFLHENHLIFKAITMNHELEHSSFRITKSFIL